MFGLTRLTPALRSLMPRVAHQTKVVRHESSDPWFYRESRTEHKKGVLVATQLLMGSAWYWVLFHVWYDHEHLTGHYPYPDATKWTDAELGIPADDED